MQQWIIKQNLEFAYNLEFDEYLEVLFHVSEAGFCAEVQKFGRELSRYVLRIRVTNNELRQLNEQVLTGEAPEVVLVAGQLSLETAKELKQSIEEKLSGDYPKFCETKTNFWRYLLRLVPVYIGKGCSEEAYNAKEYPYDYKRDFAVATACLLQLNSFCFKVGQLHLLENCRTFWIAMFLHFFGERFRGREKCAFLQDLDLASHAVKIEITVKEAKTEGENKSKKSRKKKKKRQK